MATKPKSTTKPKKADIRPEGTETPAEEKKPAKKAAKSTTKPKKADTKTEGTETPAAEKKPAKKTTGSIIARTFFITIQQKNLENLGITTDWEKPDEIIEQLNALYEDIGGKHYSAICESAAGLRHIHEAVTFDKPKRLNAVANLYGKAHIEQMRGTKEDAIKYINKEGKFEEKGEQILAKWGDPGAIENNAGTRSDLADFDKKALEEDFNLNDFLLTQTNENTIKMYTNRFYRLKEQAASGIRDIEVYYIEGKAGSGKTSGALKRSPNAFIVDMDPDNHFPFDGYACQNTVIFDELRYGRFTHAYLMRLLDRYKMNVNVKGGHAPVCWTKVYITSAQSLKEWYSDRGLTDAENKKAQFLRRINHHYKAIGGEWYEYDAEPGKDKPVQA